MILVDTNIFVDLWTRDPACADWSEEALARAAEAGPLGINPIIYAELCLGFEQETQLEETLAEAGVRRLALPYQAAWPAAPAFGAYRRRGGQRSTPFPISRFLHRCPCSRRRADAPHSRRPSIPKLLPRAAPDRARPTSGGLRTQLTESAALS